MLVITLPSIPEVIAATTVVLLLVATASALCCCREQTDGSAAPLSNDDGNNNSNSNTDNNDERLNDRSQGMPWYFCCLGKKRTQTRDFATLNDLLLEVDENETGWLNVVSTPRSATEQSRLEVSVDSFFPDILSESARKGGRGRSATAGSREDLHETLL
jgi:hypothetical protein